MLRLGSNLSNLNFGHLDRRLDMADLLFRSGY
jgi:hypothetical protein